MNTIRLVNLSVFLVFLVVKCVRYVDQSNVCCLRSNV